MQTRVFELHAVAFLVFFYSSTRNWSCVPFQVFFLRYTYKARRASPISTSTSTSTTLLDVPTLPYLTLHYSPLERYCRYYTRKEGQVPYVAQINIGKGTYLPT